MEHWGDRDARWDGIYTDAVDVQGTPVRVLRVDGASSATPRLLIHGLGGAATNWLEVMVGLSGGAPVVAPDLPGFGKTAPPTDRAADVRAQATFVPALMESLGYDRVELHGNSMGGMIATMVAARYQERIERLVLASPALPAPRREAHRINPQVLARFAPFSIPGLGHWVMRRAWQKASIDEIYADTIDLVYADPERIRPAVEEVAQENLHYGIDADWRLPSFSVAAESVVAMVTGARTLLRAVDQITAPTLLVWGDQDRLVPGAVLDGLEARRPDWRRETLSGVGHAPMLEAPDRYLELVTAWRAAGTPTPQSA